MRHARTASTVIVIGGVLLLTTGPGRGAPGGYTGQTRQRQVIDSFEDIAGWKTGGQKEVRFELSDKHVKQGGHSLRMHVGIDHHQAKEVKKQKYPMGWPALRKSYGTPVGLSDCDFIDFCISDGRRVLAEGIGGSQQGVAR